MGEERRLSGEDRQLLVAYLDNEVPEDVAAMLESKIAGSVSARREVEELRHTWDLLDFLPMPEASNDFSQRTMEVLSQAERSQGRWSENLVVWGKRVGAIAAVVAGAAACFVAGSAIVTQMPDRNRRLIEDLPVLERLDEYQAVRDVEFLKLLRTFKTLDAIDDPFKPNEDAESK